MNHSTQRPRLTRGAHDPAAHANNIVGLFTSIFPLLAYIGRILNDTMCDHASPEICDRCQRRLYTIGAAINGTVAAVSGWSKPQRARLDARLAIAAARRLLDTIELGSPVAWAMKGGAVVTTGRRAVNAAAALLRDPDLGAVNAANAAARECQQLDQSTSRVARKRGLAQESLIIGYVLKAAGKAAEAAVAATESTWAQDGSARKVDMARAAGDFAGAAVGAALDGAALLDIDPGRSEAMMVVATGVCAEFDRMARPAADDGDVYVVDAPISLGGPAAVTFPRETIAGVSCAEVAEWRAGDTPSVPCENSPSQAELAPVCAAVRSIDIGLGCLERVTVDGIGYGCVKLGDHVEHVTALGAAWWKVETEAVELDIIDAAAAVLETPTEEYNVMDDFNESELGDVADEAIGDAAALAADLERAEAILNAISEEHRPVEAWSRRPVLDAEEGVVSEYKQRCCVSCRDAEGRPVPAPCRTMAIINGFGES